MITLTNGVLLMVCQLFIKEKRIMGKNDVSSITYVLILYVIIPQSRKKTVSMNQR